jgi:serine/threonine protein kinase
MADVLKKFGRYFLLDHLAQGGMAEIYRARLAAVDGAGRLIVIKRIQAGYGANAEFLQMFKSEIKVTMGFNHPNIVQLYDFGEENEQPYIAMEWVEGRNLRQFMNRFSELKQQFPVELAAYVMEQAAAGLHYAHNFKDKMSGSPLNIVHRDISPQNVLVSYEGNVKIIDFGIAKASNNSESTRAGVIKGKPSYLSPEQISGEVLDGRSDLFSLGIVLWEMLCGRKLFSGESDLAVLKQIESCQTHVKAPSTVNSKVPKELDYIVLKALAKQREKRFQNGEEMQRALHKFLYTFQSDFNPSDLAYYAKDLFKNEIVEDRKRIQRLNDKCEQLLATEIPEVPLAVPPGAPSRTEEPTTTMVEAKRAPEVALPGHFKDAKVELEPNIRALKQAGNPRGRPPSSGQTATLTVPSTLPPTKILQPTRAQGTTRVQGPPPRMNVKRPSNQSSRSPGWLKSAGGAAVALLAISWLGPTFGLEVPLLSEMLGVTQSTNTARLELRGSQRDVLVSINGKTVAHALPTVLRDVPAGASLRVNVTGAGGSFQRDLTMQNGERKSIDVVLSGQPVLATGGTTESPGSAVTPGKNIQLRLNVSPGGGGAHLAINGRVLDPSNPTLVVALDAPLELVAERSGYRVFKREFVLDSRQLGGLREWIMDVPMEPSRYGFLTIHTTPSAEATIMLDGKPWVRKTPIDNEKLPVGTYSIRLNNEVLGMEKTVTVMVQEGKSIVKDERLDIMREPASSTGGGRGN